MNQGKVEEITLQEEPMKLNSLEDYFDDEGFGEMDTDSIGWYCANRIYKNLYSLFASNCWWPWRYLQSQGHQV